jgi:hypothetical protein
VADVVERTDVRMIERGNRAGLAVEPLAQLRIGRERLRQDLNRDGPIEPRVAGAVHLAHPTGADRCDDLVRSQPRASFERHRTGEL